MVGASLLALALVAVGLFLVLKLEDKNQPGPGPTPTVGQTTVPPGATTVPSTDLKLPLHGLIDRGGLPAAEFRTGVSASVVNARWADLQPQKDGPLADANPIDDALAQTRQANAADPAHPLRIKLRLSAGVNAPDWAKQIGGPPVAVADPTSEASGTVGRFWTDEFGRAYARLQQLVAARYDAVPEIAEITISRCTTVFAEPFIRQASNPAAAQALLAAGYTVEADQRCQREQVDAHAVWRQTRVGLAFNPYQRLEAGRGVQIDEAFTESMMGYCRSVLGSRCVLENNSIRWPVQGGEMARMYGEMKRLGAPISFQTAAPERIGDLEMTLRWAFEQGANAVELPRTYPNTAPGLLDSSAARLRQNPSGK